MFSIKIIIVILYLKKYFNNKSQCVTSQKNKNGDLNINKRLGACKICL